MKHHHTYISNNTHLLVGMFNNANIFLDIATFNWFLSFSEIDEENHLRSALAAKPEAEGTSDENGGCRRHVQTTNARFYNVITCNDR